MATTLGLAIRVVFTTVLATGAVVARAADYVSYSGTAVDVQSRAFRYGERDVLAYVDGRLAERVVLYTCRDGTPFARKTVSYVDSFAPNFTLEDASDGMREGIRGTGGERQVFFREAPAAAEKSGALPPVAGLVADAGFDEFVRARWQPLTGDRTVTMRFLVPSRLNDMAFKVQQTRSDRVDGVPVDVFRLKLAGIIGWILPGIDVYYSVPDRELLRYVGLSDLRDASGDNMKVDITFNPSDRHPASAEQIETARHARLAPCR
jgi:hypothetical protein